MRVCRRHGLPVTIQRRLVMEELLTRDDHPTADQVFEGLLARGHAISRTTVYRVLETFVRLGVARVVCSPGASARFDHNLEQHHHLVCLYCGRISDLDDPRLNGLKLPNTGPSFEINDYTIHFRGTCGDCRRRLRETRGPKVRKLLRQR